MRSAATSAVLSALLIACIAAGLTGLGEAKTCAPGWSQSGNSCYKSSGTSGSHNTVRSVCQRQGGDLTSIHSDAENRFVSSVGSFQNAHIGARDEGSEGNWYWDDGSSWDYSKWDPGEPNNCGCAPNGPEHCGHLWRNWGDYKGWNDIWCHYSIHGVCKNIAGTVIELFSCGLNAWYNTGGSSKANGRGVNIKFNGGWMNPGYSRGFNVYEMDESGPGIITAQNYYDTYAHSSRATDMANRLNSISNGKIIIILCWDECDNNGANAYGAMNSLGGSVHNSLGFRDSYIGVFKKGHRMLWEERSQSQCLFGYYTSPYDACATGKYASSGSCTNCPSGKYGDATGYTSSSQCKNCPSGKYGGSSGLTSSSCSGNSAAGYWTSAGSASSTQNTCNAGRYGSAGQTSGSCSGPAAAGHYTLAGSSSSTQHDCPAGRYGNGGSSSSACTGACSAGYYCPASSSSGTQNTCGGNNYYCPAGAGSRTTVSSGHYSTGGGSTTRTGQSQCGTGKYCSSGVRYDCPAGKYGSSNGLSSASCSGSCHAGYYCPAGSSSNKQNACGTGVCAAKPANCYCPGGASAPTTVSAGHYSTPESAPEDQRTGQTACGTGYECTDGKRKSRYRWENCAGSPSGDAHRSLAEGASGTLGAAITADMDGASPSYAVSSTSRAAGCSWDSAPGASISSSGVITISNGNRVDYERCKDWIVTITASANSQTLTCRVNVEVENVNESPSLPSSTCAQREVEEKSAINTDVGSAVTASDPDEGQALLYSITGGTGASLFKISTCSGQIQVNDDNIEHNPASPTYTLSIQVKDDAPAATQLSASCTVTVKILNRNDPPQFDAQSYTLFVNENVGTGTIPVESGGGKLPAHVSDEDGDSVSWTTVNNDSPNNFNMNSGTGDFFVSTAAIDYETKSRYTYKIRATDPGGLYAEADVFIVINDQNDNPKLVSTSFAVLENSAVGAKVGGPVEALDQDPEDTHSFAVTDSDSFFVMDSTDLEVAKTGLDFEGTKSYTVNIRVTDSAGGTGDGQVSVALMNVNEAPSISGQSRSIIESSGVGSNIGSPLSASDPEGSALTFSIESGNVGSMLAIGAFTGQLTIASALDHETVPTLSPVIKVYDGELDDTATITVTVTNANEAPVIQADQERSIDENSDEESNVGAVVTATDPELDAVSWAINDGNDLSTFAITASTGQITVANSLGLDFEQRATFSLKLVASDPSGAKSAPTAVTIRVNNLNEAPQFDEYLAALQLDEDAAAEVERAIVENKGAGTAVGSAIKATDEDGDTVIYSIVSQPAQNYYTINTGTGQVSVASGKTTPGVDGGQIDHDLTIRAADEGGKSSDIALTVHVTDVNDAPVFANQARSVAENSASDTNVGAALIASDPDVGDTVSFAIKSGNVGTVFKIDADSGQISVSNPALNHESPYDVYSLVVQAKDSRSVPLTTDATITITVTDVNEAPDNFAGVLSVDENSPVGRNAGSITTTDQDDGQTDDLEYKFVAGNSAGLWAINTDTGVVSVSKAVLNFESTPEYSLTVRATDPGGLYTDGFIKIEILNVNDPPVFATLPPVSLREDADVGVEVGGPPAVTDEDGDAQTFSIKSGNSADKFAINSASGQLTVKGGLDFESTAKYTLTLKTDDGKGGTAETTRVINLIDTNESPTVSAASASVNENVASGTAVKTMSVSDPDAGDSHSWSISGGNDGDIFAINRNSGAVTVNIPPNFEAKNSYSVSVTAIDSGGLSSTAVLSVTIVDVNEAPVLSPHTRRIKENSQKNTDVGIALPFVDVDAGDSHTWTITAGNDGTLWAIDSGQLTVAKDNSLDFETRNEYKVTVKVTDEGGLWDAEVMTIVIDDVNENPVMPDATREVDENSDVNTRVGDAIPASDQDLGQLLQYTIVSGNEDGKFKINPCDGQIQVAIDALDYETLNQYTLELKVTDDGGTVPGPPRLTDTATVTINILNVNEPPVLADATYTVNENSAANTLVNDVALWDPEQSEQDFSWTVVRGNDAGYFKVDSVSDPGKLRIATLGVNFEAVAKYELVLKVVDNGDPSLSAQALYTVNVLDVNENPVVAAQTRAVDENVADDTLVGVPIVFSDQDAGDWGDVTFSIEGGFPFSIVAATGQIRVDGALDHETTASYDVEVTAHDGGDPSLTGTGVITIDIGDVNEAPVIDNQARSVDENSPPGTAVGAALASSDVDDGQTRTYSITAESVPGMFSLDAVTGQISVRLGGLNYEALSSYSLTVKVTDSHPNALTDDAVISITIVDINEAPVVVAGQQRSVYENTAVGTPVGQALSFSDQDAGDSITLAITDGDPDRQFLINNAGQVSVLGSLDLETKGVYVLQISATDKAGAVGRASVTVTLLNVNENPVFSSEIYRISAAENTAVDVKIGSLPASDVDAGHVLTWSFDTSISHFKVDPDTGDILMKTADTVQALATYAIDVRVVDELDASDTALLLISIVDVNEAPTITNAATSRSVSESAAVGTNVGAAITATDEENDNLVFTIDSGNDDSAFEIVGSTGQIKVKTAGKLDFESAQSRVIRVVCTDDGEGALSTSSTVTIQVTNANEAPTMRPGELSIAENTAADTVVGTVSGSDPDAGDYFILSIVSGNAGGVFELEQQGVASTGTINVAKNALNYELKSKYDLVVQARDSGGLTSQATIVVVIQDANDVPVMADQTRTIAENSLVGALVGQQLPATDEDLLQTLSYEILSGNANDAFSVNTQGQLSVRTRAALNFEDSSRNDYTISVRVSDDGNPGDALSIVRAVDITVLDVNENPIWSSSVFAGAIEENTAKGTVVDLSGIASNKLTATDPEISYQTLSYGIAGDSPNFQVDSATGLVTLKEGGKLNFESRNLYELTMQATDDDEENPLTSTTLLKISVIDVNEAPVWNKYDTTPVFTVKENTDAGTACQGAVAATDVDAGENGELLYAIVGGDGQFLFAVDESSAELFSASAAFNFENTKQYTLELRVRDGGLLTDFLDVLAKIQDVNEAPELADSYTRDIDENSGRSQPVNGGAIPATDVDFGQQETLFFEITGGDGEDVFSINACSGIITVKLDVIDYEVKSEYTLNIKVTDDDTLEPPNLSDVSVVTIDINDLNEAPTAENQARAVNENSAIDTPIGAPLEAADEDRPANVLTFSIVSGNDAGLFKVDGATGQLSVAKAALDHEAQETYSLVLRVEDEEPLYTTFTVVVTVLDINEAPTMPDATCSVAENSAAGTFVCTLTASDQDQAQALTYTVETNAGFVVATSNNLGRVTVKAQVLNFEAQPVHVVSVTVTDDGVINGNTLTPLSITRQLTVSIIDVNEAPTLAAQARSVAENSAFGTLVGSPLVAADPDGQAEFLRWAIVSGNDEKRFNITRLGGQLSVISAGLNFETKPTYTLKISVRDTGYATSLSASADVVVSLINVNEAPVFVTAHLTVPENSPPDLVAVAAVAGEAPAVSGTDVDVSTNDELSLTYAFADDSLTNGAFAIDPDTGRLTVADDSCVGAGDSVVDESQGIVVDAEPSHCVSLVLDHETKPQWVLQLKVTDQHGLSDSGTALVDVTNANEYPWLVAPAQPVSIAEQAPEGSVVFVAQAADFDAGAVLSFSLTGPDVSAFAIDRGSGTVTVQDPSDDALKFVTGGVNQANVTVFVADEFGFEDWLIYVITVVDGNFPPTIAAQTVSIDENQPVGSAVAPDVVGVEANDDDQHLFYSITSVVPLAAAPLFEIETIENALPAVNTGRIKVADASALAKPPALDHETYPVVTLTVVVTDDGPGFLTASSKITVNVNDINEAPVLTSPTADATLSVDENSAVDSVVGPPIIFNDQDEGDFAGTLTLGIVSTQEGDEAAAFPFQIDQLTGQVSVRLATLDFEARATYPVRITVADTSGASDTLDMVIRIANVNEHPVVNAQALSVAENSPVGFSVGSIIASDIDAEKLDSVLTYEFVSPDTAAADDGSVAVESIFVVDEHTGEVTVNQADVDFERDSTYTVTIKVIDDGNLGTSSPLSDTATFTINVVDINDVAITGFNLDGSDAAADIATVLHPTSGGQEVTILGHDFGPVVAPAQAVTVSAYYYSRQDPTTIFLATGCSVVVANTKIRCTTGEGVGKDLVWVITVGAWTHTSTIVTSHISPAITNVAGADALPTRGGALVTLTGTNFGKVGTQIDSVTYGPGNELRYKAVLCQVTLAHTTITCTSTSGVGHTMKWRVAIKGLASPSTLEASTSHADPAIEAIALPDAPTPEERIAANGGAFGSEGRLLNTIGGQRVVLTGDNFGSAAEEDRLVVTYGPTGTELVAVSCRVTVDHTEVQCSSASGIGSEHAWVATADGVASPQSADLTSYFRPRIVTVSGAGAVEGDTDGKMDLVLTGTDMGPVGQPTDSVIVEYGVGDAGEVDRFAAAGCYVSSAHSQVSCKTVAGTGKDHPSRVTIGAQTSDVQSDDDNLISYARPVLINFHDLGAANADTEGGQKVRIEGRQFGTIEADEVDMVTYGLDDDAESQIFTAVDCHVINHHTMIECTTDEGAGRNLKWVVVIDGQLSGAPTTYYHKPVITSVTSANSSFAFSGMKTDGGEVVEIHGTDFGPAEWSGEFLESVSYGAGGTEFQADLEQCTGVSHTLVRCVTRPGVGANLQWYMTVLGQVSDESRELPDALSAYAPPRFVTAEPLTGSTTGGYKVAVTGTNLGMFTYRFDKVRTSSLEVRFGGKVLDADTAVSGYEMLGDSLHGLRFTVPEALQTGADRDVQLAVVDQYGFVQESQVLTFTYNDPAIRVDGAGDAVYRLKNNVLRVEGADFGLPTPDTYLQVTALPGSDGTDAVIQSLEALTWTHDAIEVIYDGTRGTVVVHRGAQNSNVGTFLQQSPEISNINGANGDDTFYDGEGGDLMTVRGSSMGEADKLDAVNITVLTAGPEGAFVEKECVLLHETFVNIPGQPIPNTTPQLFEDDEQQISCVMPPGQGLDNAVRVRVRGQTSPKAEINYEQPWIRSVATNWAQNSAEAPTTGVDANGDRLKITVEGRNFGVGWNTRLTLMRDNREFKILQNCDFTFATSLTPSERWSRAVCDMPEGEGADLYVQIRVDPSGQDIVDNPLGQFRDYSTPLPIANADKYGYPNGDRQRVSYAKPVIELSAAAAPARALSADAEAGAEAAQAAAEVESESEAAAYAKEASDVSASSSSSSSSSSSPEAAPRARVLSYTHTGPTEGGWTFHVSGDNMGRPSTATPRPATPTVTLSSTDPGVSPDGTPVVIDCPVSYHDHSTIECTMPDGAGVNYEVTVEVQGVTNEDPKPLFSFLPPVADSGEGAGDDVPTTGGVNVTLTGSNFGASPTLGLLQLRVSTDPVRASYQDEIVVDTADILEWGHTKVVYLLPEGQGRDRRVQLMMAGQSNAIAGADAVMIDYAAPVIAPLPEGIVSSVEAASFGQDKLPTTGLYEVTVHGSNFGTEYAWVHMAHTSAIAGFDCSLFASARPAFLPPPAGVSAATGDDVECAIPVTSHTHDQVTFQMVPGIGKDFEVRLYVGTRPSEPLLLSYDAPAITSIQPNAPDALGEEIVIYGKNFGSQSVGLGISIGGLNCTQPKYIAPECCVPGTSTLIAPKLECQVQNQTVGYKGVYLSVAGQEVTYTFDHQPPLVLAQCDRNFYGQLGEACLECPRGAYCDGKFEEPISEEGWWIYTTDEAVLCPPARVATRNGTCPVTLPCEPTNACMGNNVCAPQYRGERCADCADRYYRRAGECVECPKNPLVLIIGMVVAALFLCTAGYFLNKNSVNLAFVSIGVDYFQVLAMFANSRIQWPPLIKDLFHLLSAFNFNIEITAPECSIPDLSYISKWRMTMALPLIALTLFLVLHLGILSYKYCILRRRKNLNRHASALFGTGLVLFYYLYLLLTRGTLDVFNCAPTDPSDGHTYLAVVFERCDKPVEEGGVHLTLLPFAVLALLFYTLGFPALVSAILFRNKRLIMEDQVLRAMDTGNDKLTNRNAYDVRKRYHKMYYHFKPDYYFWILCIVARKAFLAFTTLMFNRNPAFQLAVALLIMFVSYALQVKYRPYMSMSERQAVIEDHEAKAKDGHKLHAQIAAAVESMRAKAKKVYKKNQVDTSLTLRDARSYLFDYNTVEMVLLGCAVLVTLAGTMFESGQLDSEFYASQRDAITVMCMIVICFSLIYFFWVLFDEIYRTLCNKPKKLKGKAAAKAKEERSKEFQRRRRSTKLAGVNPLMASALSARSVGSDNAGAGAGGSGGGGGGGGGASGDAMSAVQFEEMQREMAELRRQNDRMKTAQAMGGAVHAPSGTTKREFRARPAGVAGRTKRRGGKRGSPGRNPTRTRSQEPPSVEMSAVDASPFQ